MKPNIAPRSLAILFLALALAASAQANDGGNCSNARAAGDWAYTYTGTIFTQNGPLPTASVGRFSQDTAGNITGSQTRSVAGNSGVEEISGNVSVNPDCTASATINVLVNGQLQRTAVLALVYDNNGKHARMIFQSLTLPNGTNIPVVITVEAAKLSPRD